MSAPMGPNGERPRPAPAAQPELAAQARLAAKAEGAGRAARVPKRRGRRRAARADQPACAAA